jgi:hypothetical protein
VAEGSGAVVGDVASTAMNRLDASLSCFYVDVCVVIKHGWGVMRV